jgi:hypothetical protein
VYVCGVCVHVCVCVFEYIANVFSLSNTRTWYMIMSKSCIKILSKDYNCEFFANECEIASLFSRKFKKVGF